MTAKDVRLGNIVRDSDGNDIRVNRLRSHIDQESKLSIKSEDRINEITPDHFTGIPLDDKWLMKMGFKKDSEFWVREEIKLYPNGRSFAMNNFSIEISYVHQLQNLLKAILGFDDL